MQSILQKTLRSTHFKMFSGRMRRRLRAFLRRVVQPRVPLPRRVERRPAALRPGKVRRAAAGDQGVQGSQGGPWRDEWSTVRWESGEVIRRIIVCSKA